MKQSDFWFRQARLLSAGEGQPLCNQYADAFHATPLLLELFRPTAMVSGTWWRADNLDGRSIVWHEWQDDEIGPAEGRLLCALFCYWMALDDEAAK